MVVSRNLAFICFSRDIHFWARHWQARRRDTKSEHASLCCRLAGPEGVGDLLKSKSLLSSCCVGTQVYACVYVRERESERANELAVQGPLL